MRLSLAPLLLLLAAAPGCRAAPDGGPAPTADAGLRPEARPALPSSPPTPGLGDGRVRFLPDGPVVRVELALTPASQARGLMYREHLAPDQGMLFVFPAEEHRTFWMRNTLIPLDMIFIGQDLRVVGVVHEAAPLTDTPREVPAPSRYVLEMSGGWARAHDVAAGTEVALDGVPR